MTSALSAPATNPTAGPLPATDPGLVWRQQRPGLDIVRIGSRESCEYDLTFHPLPNEDLKSMLYRLEDTLREFKAVPVLQFVFGSLDKLRDGEAAMDQVFGESAWPVTFVDGTGTVSNGLAGMQVIALSEREIKRVKLHGRVAAILFDNGTARHCLLGGLGYSRPQESRSEQTRQALEDLESLLAQNGFAMGDIARTWFYLEDILSWYGDFNKVRNTKYYKHTFRVGSLPASTGVAAKNPAGSALALAAWATRPLHESAFPVREIISPLQCPAPCYGSAFSRAVEMDLPAGRRLLISGTASIEPGGKTVWTGDIEKQIGLTMEVVEAILKSRDMSLDDVSRATLYFKRPEFTATFAEWCSRHGRKLLPGLLVHCDICRDDLLFEIELDTVKIGLSGLRV